MDFTVSGNPFAEKSRVKDHNSPEQNFSEILDRVSKVKSEAKDQFSISMESILSELPSGASKIDKVVYLLKKGFTSQKIADELGLAVPEVDLIKTFRMDKA